jgi:hypothetical protein
MSKKPTKKPSRRPARRFLVRVPNYFSKIPEGKRYAPKELTIVTRSALWWDKGMTYVRAYHELLDIYMVCKYGLPPLINAEHVGLWLLLVRWQGLGKIFTLEELAEALDISLHTLRARLNRLADIRLIHFERCESQGRPVDIVLHTPLRSNQLTAAVHAGLYSRFKTRYTDGMRSKLGQDWPGRWRVVEDIFPGTAIQKKKAREIVIYLCWLEREESGGEWRVEHFLKEFKILCEAAGLLCEPTHTRAAIVYRRQLAEDEFTEEDYKKIDRILKRKKQ